MELGTPGALRDEFNRLVLDSRKRAPAGLVSEYAQDGEPIEHVGECLALLDNDGRQVATIEVTEVEVMPFIDIPWSLAEAEGEGDADLESGGLVTGATGSAPGAPSRARHPWCA